MTTPQVDIEAGLPESAPPVRKREIFGWAMFDFANSSYTTLIVTVAFSVYFTKLVVPGPRADFYWGLGIFASNVLVILLSPVIGAMADDTGRKKLFLAGTYLSCVVGTAALFFVIPGRITLGLALFVVSNVAFSLGENLAGAFLPEISTPANIGRISGLGWGLGYFGGLACLVACWPLLQGDFVAENIGKLRLIGPVTGGFFLLAALPTFIFLRERAARGPRRSLPQYVKVSFGRLATTARSLRHFGALARFLAVFVCYSSGLMTVIAFASIYAERTLGFTAGELAILFMALQLSSAAGAVGFGQLQDRLGARHTLQLALLVWIAVCVGAYFAQTKAVFWGVALFAGLGIGSLQATSRAVVGLFSPPEKAGEFFGFWGLSNRVAYAIGPLVFGVLSSATGSQRLAILATAVFFIVGLFGLRFVDEDRGRREAHEWHMGHRQGAAAEPVG